MGESEAPNGLLLKCGTRNFSLHLNPTKPTTTTSIESPTGHAHLAFKVTQSDFEKAVSRFEQMGIPTKGPIQWKDHQCLYVLDPDGNLLELVNLWRPGLSWLGTRARGG